ncbi:MAG: sporulation integral membrane protein YtvI [Oscillospiraceae bacterium]|jgi:sporulation integral membrane protein YtvI|nr:sporulation integral membrane protein YtvI [Oscillospiraceae bacterium]
MQLNTRTETHLGRIINVVYYLMILAGFYFFMKYVFWLAFPFLFAFFVAMLLQSPMNYAHRKIRLKKGFTAVSLVLLFYTLVLALVGYAGMRVFGELSKFFTYLSQQNPARILLSVARQIPRVTAWLPQGLEDRVGVSVNEFITNLEGGESTGVWEFAKNNINIEWFKAPVSGLLATAGKIPSAVIAVVITIVASFFMTLGYDVIVGFIKRQLSAARQEALSAAKRIFVQSLGKLLRSYATIMAVTFAELMLGLGLLRMINVQGAPETGYLLPIGLAIAVVDILPVLGTGSVMVPWALYSLLMQNYAMGAGLIAIYAVILIVRQVLEPKLVAANLGLPPILTLAGMYIGLKLFGFVGLLLVPLVLILVKVLNDEGVIRLWKPSRAVVAPPPKPTAKNKPGKGR